jgi:hypothetical protein
MRYDTRDDEQGLTTVQAPGDVLPPGSVRTRVTMQQLEAALWHLLELPLRPGDTSRLQRRRQALIRLFDQTASWDADELHSRLTFRFPGDALAEAFHYRLATATRRTLLDILRRRAGSSGQLETEASRPPERFGWFGAPLSQIAPPNWCQMRQTIAATARAEEARWTRPNGTKLIESNPSQLAILTQYWSTVPGFGSPAAARQAALRSANDLPNGEWSAAFICFVMHTAGVRPAHGFEFGQRHMNYIVGALRNRERSDHSRPFWLVDHLELQHEAAPQAGDLLCFNRMANGAMTRHSTSSLRNQFWLGGNQNRPPRGSSHCRLVVSQTQIGGQRFIETIGGNESNSVRLRRIPADNDGMLPNAQALNIFGMIKLVGC